MPSTASRIIKAFIFIPLLTMVGGALGAGAGCLLTAAIIISIQIIAGTITPTSAAAIGAIAGGLGTLTGVTLAITFIVRTEIARGEPPTHGFPVMPAAPAQPYNPVDAPVSAK